jgi:hypothetical protein
VFKDDQDRSRVSAAAGQDDDSGLELPEEVEEESKMLADSEEPSQLADSLTDS